MSARRCAKSLEDHQEAVDFACRVLTGQIDIVIFLTGVGFRPFLSSVERSVDKQRLLDALSDITTVARGPAGGRHAKVGLTPSLLVPEPNTWRELLRAIDQQLPIANQKVGVQEYGKTNSSLYAGLGARCRSGAAHLSLGSARGHRPLEENIRAMVAATGTCCCYRRPPGGQHAAAEPPPSAWKTNCGWRCGR